MYWGRIGSQGRKVQKSCRRHISTSGLAASALWTMVSPYFGLCGRTIACDASSIGPGTKISSRYTTSGSVKREVRFRPPYWRPKRVPLSGNVAQARRRARWATPTPARRESDHAKCGGVSITDSVVSVSRKVHWRGWENTVFWP